MDLAKRLKVPILLFGSLIAILSVACSSDAEEEAAAAPAPAAPAAARAPPIRRTLMAKKKVAAIVKIQIPAGQASPAPPVGTALGPHGVQIMDFCKAYNAETESQRGSIVPAEITIFEDRSFTFITKTPPTSVLIREAARLEKASSEPGMEEPVGSISQAQLEEIANVKMPDLNANDIEAAKLQVAGTARSMGIEVEG